MKKPYLIVIIALIGLGLCSVPLFASTLSADRTQISVTVGPAVELGDGAPQDQISDCGLIGVSAGYDYKGFPFVTHTSGFGCPSSSSAIYPVGIVLNFLIATALVLTANKLMERRKK